MIKGDNMKTSEYFALDEWLTEYPDDLTYDEVITILRSPKRSRQTSCISVWEVAEDWNLEQVASFIEDTKQHFEKVTQGRLFDRIDRMWEIKAEEDSYEKRVQELEEEGMTRSDAQGVVDAEILKEKP
jgi:hypothetical protein